MEDTHTIGNYLLSRLAELGIHHIFGVPGDYNLSFLDLIEKSKELTWVGNCNELNAAYAADGYARVKGAGALVTTFGVGELSAINGVGGSYAELVPVVHIVGVPSKKIRANKSLVHHSLGDGNFEVFADMYREVTVAQAYLTEKNAAEEIDRVLTTCWIKKRPVYITLPSDVALKPLAPPRHKLDLHYPASNTDAIKEIVERITQMLHGAKSPVVLVDVCAQRFGMQTDILNFLAATKVPFAVMNMSKGIIDESHSQFVGNYCGSLSTEGVQELVEQSDCLISFGSLLTDFNTGGFSAQLNANVSIEIHSNYTRIMQSRYDEVMFCDLLPVLNAKIKGYVYHGKIMKVPPVSLPKTAVMPLSQNLYWQAITDLLPKHCTVLAETGTSMFGILGITFPNDTLYIGQSLWASIGFTLGALLGACLADPQRPAFLFIGDGSFQLTAQELSTILRLKLKPTIFLINNDGYTVERAIHGATMHYNDIQTWDYTHLPQVFGGQVWSQQVRTVEELDQALQDLSMNQDKLCFVEVFLDKMDCPEVLMKLSQRMAAVNY